MCGLPEEGRRTARWWIGRREGGRQEEWRKTRTPSPARSRSLRRCPITSTTATGSCAPKPTLMQFFCTLEGKSYNCTNPVLFHCTLYWTSEGISHNFYTDANIFLLSKVNYKLWSDPRWYALGWRMGMSAKRKTQSNRHLILLYLWLGLASSLADAKQFLV